MKTDHFSFSRKSYGNIKEGLNIWLYLICTNSVSGKHAVFYTGAGRALSCHVANTDLEQAVHTIHISWFRSFRSSLTPVLRHCKWSAGAKMWGTKHGAIPLPLQVKKGAPALWVPPTLRKGAGSSVLSSSGPCADRCPCSGLLGSLPLSCLPSWEASFNPAAYASRWPKISSCSQGKKNAPWWSSQGISAGWDLSRRDPNP